jgi:23S rRNA-/tRNA-specific pseudouridylate synthase
MTDVMAIERSMKTESRGFRFGVRETKCAQNELLIDFVSLVLTKNPIPAELTALELIELGSVYVNDVRTINPVQSLKPNDRVRIHTAPRRYSAPENLNSLIISESEDSILIEKPAGLPSEPQIDNLKENLLTFLEDRRNQKYFPIHRLETDSSGLMLLAKSPEAAALLSKAFSEGQVKRRFAAYTEAPLVPGRDDTDAIQILNCQQIKTSTSLVTEGRSSWLIQGEALRMFNRIEVEFTKVRPKDVRQHLSQLGAPILGDRLLGSRIELLDSITMKSTVAFRALSLTPMIKGGKDEKE